MTAELVSTADLLRWSVCCHEAGHAWARHHSLGGGLGVISVRRAARRHAGVTIGGPDRPPPDLHIVGTALEGLDPSERQLGDRWLLMLLLGDATEAALELWMPPGGWGQPRLVDNRVLETLTPAVAV